MGMPVLIYGKSGSGKSRSIKNFAEDEIFFVNVERKFLPFRKTFKYLYESDNSEKIQILTGTIFQNLPKRCLTN